MANPTQPGIEVLSKEFKRDDNDTVLCTDRVEVKVRVTSIPKEDCFYSIISNMRDLTFDSRSLLGYRSVCRVE